MNKRIPTLADKIAKRLESFLRLGPDPTTPHCRCNALLVRENAELKEHARKSLLKLKLALDTLRQIERTRSPRCKRLAYSTIKFIESLQ